MKKIIFLFAITVSFLTFSCSKKDKVNPVITNFNYHSGSLPIKSITLDKSYFESPVNCAITLNYNDGSIFNTILKYDSKSSDGNKYTYSIVIKDGTMKIASIQYFTGIVNNIIIDNTIFLE